MKTIATYQITITHIVDNIQDEALLKRIYEFVTFLYLRKGR